MPSLIDATRPLDDVLAVKADLRNNLAMAKAELNHGGYYTGHGGEQTVQARLLAAPVDFREYGSISTPAQIRASLQAAIDDNFLDGRVILIPVGDWQIDQPLVMPNLTVTGSLQMLGAGVNAKSNRRSMIVGNFADSLIRTGNRWVTYNPSTLDYTLQGPGGGSAINANVDSVCFYNTHVDGFCIQGYNFFPPSSFRRCTFFGSFGGLYLLQAFDVGITDCNFQFEHFTSRTIDQGHYEHAYALYGVTHAVVNNCNFNGCGTAMMVAGVNPVVNGVRIEACGIGIRLGVHAEEGGTLAPDVFGQGQDLKGGVINGVSMEANWRGIYARIVAPSTVLNGIIITSGTNGPRVVGPPAASQPLCGIQLNQDTPFHIISPQVSSDSLWETGSGGGAIIGTGTINRGDGSHRVVTVGTETLNINTVQGVAGSWRYYTSGGPMTATIDADSANQLPYECEWYIEKPSGSGNLTLAPSGATTINGSINSLTFSTNGLWRAKRIGKTSDVRVFAAGTYATST